MRPFAFVSNWEAFEITPEELVDNPTEMYIRIGEYKQGNALGIALELTNTTQSCITVNYSCGNSKNGSDNWGNAAVNQENLKMTLSSGEKGQFIFYASPEFIKNNCTIELPWNCIWKIDLQNVIRKHSSYLLLLCQIKYLAPKANGIATCLYRTILSGDSKEIKLAKLNVLKKLFRFNTIL